jgi:hypothetical protein
MSFRLTNAPVTSQQYVSKTLNPYLDVFYTANLDNVLIYSKTLEDHIQHICQVFELLRQASQPVKPQKCEFHKTTTEYLRILIMFKGLNMDLGKVSVVGKLPIP